VSWLWAVLGVACGGDPPPPPTAGTTAVTPDPGDTADTGTTPPEPLDCAVRFAWFQKDVLSDDDGLNHEPWPTHTTTALEWNCLGTDFDYATVSNHGTGYTDLTPTGDFALDMELWTDEHPVSESGLAALVAAYSDCSCDAATTVQPLDALDDPGVADLLDGVAGLVRDRLICARGTSVEDIADQLAAGEIDRVLDTTQACHFAEGVSWSDLFDDAYQAHVGELAATHVSNNDAALQAALFEAWQETGTLGPCDAAGALCTGPLWFYDR